MKKRIHTILCAVLCSMLMVPASPASKKRLIAEGIGVAVGLTALGVSIAARVHTGRKIAVLKKAGLMTRKNLKGVQMDLLTLSPKEQAILQKMITGNTSPKNLTILKHVSNAGMVLGSVVAVASAAFGVRDVVKLLSKGMSPMEYFGVEDDDVEIDKSFYGLVIMQNGQVNNIDKKYLNKKDPNKNMGGKMAYLLMEFAKGDPKKIYCVCPKSSTDDIYLFASQDNITVKSPVKCVSVANNGTSYSVNSKYGQLCNGIAFESEEGLNDRKELLFPTDGKGNLDVIGNIEVTGVAK